MTVELYQGDCLEIMKTLGQVDAIITDLPYGTTACSWDEIIPFEPMWKEVKRILKPRGVFVTTASQPFTSKLVMSNLDWFKYEWIWNKVNPSGFQISKIKPLTKHENILVFGNGAINYYPVVTDAITKNIRPINKGVITKRDQAIPIPNGFSKSSEGYDNKKRLPTSIIELSKFSGECNSASKERVHPTQKPVALLEYLIRTYTNEGDTVLDICAGSGTTGVAAINTGRNAILIEKESKYIEIIERRIAEAQQQPSLLEVV